MLPVPARLSLFTLSSWLGALPDNVQDILAYHGKWDETSLVRCSNLTRCRNWPGVIPVTAGTSKS